jgi:hypothetical protein
VESSHTEDVGGMFHETSVLTRATCSNTPEDIRYCYCFVCVDILTWIRRVVDILFAGNHVPLEHVAKPRAATVFCFHSLHLGCRRNGIRDSQQQNNSVAFSLQANYTD